ncbi:hypothetical protein V3C99_009088 [Haemonchus contortus]|uniref:Reverse transcriptase domain-containing protein n=1 Tax=Haemonchus contortus TaxID=6289 RepID=A0A7I4YM88_HAECO
MVAVGMQGAHIVETSKTVLLYKKGDPDDIDNYRPIGLLSVIYQLFTRVILNRIGRILVEGQPCDKQGFGEDDIVLITPNIERAEQMLAKFDSVCGRIGLNLKLNEDYVHEKRTGREVNMMNDLAPELCRRKRAAWGAFKNIEGVVKKTKNIQLRAYLSKLLFFLL